MTRDADETCRQQQADGCSGKLHPVPNTDTDYLEPILLLNYTVSQIKTPMQTIVHNFVKFLPIFTIL